MEEIEKINKFPLFFPCSKEEWSEYNSKINDNYGWNDGEGNQTYSEPFIDMNGDYFLIITTPEICELIGVNSEKCLYFEQIDWVPPVQPPFPPK